MEAEQSVIGSMIMDREAIIVASEIVLGEDFYNKQYGVLFDTMVELNDEGRPVDLVTLQDRLKEKDVPPEVSSLEFIRDLITAVPTSANIKHYANIVAEKSTLRRLIRINEDIANTCYVGKDSLEDILADTEKRIFDLVRHLAGHFAPGPLAFAARQLAVALFQVVDHPVVLLHEQPHLVADLAARTRARRVDFLHLRDVPHRLVQLVERLGQQPIEEL